MVTDCADLPAGATTSDCSRTTFSIIVPVYRQWDLVPGLLGALDAQAPVSGGFEVILVDNAPGDGGLRAPELPPFARVIPCARPGSYAARNLGAAAARGRWLVFTDADCLPEPGWLAGFAAEITGEMGAAGTTLLAGPVRLVGAAEPNPCEIYDIVRGIPQARYVARGYAATANLALPRAIFEALGGFDPARFSGGDAEFCRRAGRAGHAPRLVPGAVTAHPARADWAALGDKARRIKGGQITAGPLPRRAAWALRTLCPPVGDLRAYLGATEFPPRWRRTAAAMRLRLWGVELAETLRLLAGGAPRR